MRYIFVMIFLQQNCVENSILKHPFQMANMFLQLKVDFDHWCSKRERGDDSQSLEFFHQRGENPLDHHNYFKCQPNSTWLNLNQLKPA